MGKLTYLTPNLPKHTPRITLKDGSTLIYKTNPIPNPSSTPTSTTTTESSLPPLLRKSYPPRSKVTDTLVQELRELRNSNPDIWTVSALCKRFNLAPDTVQRFAPCPKERKDRLRLESEKEFEEMNLTRKHKIINRIRRREFW